MMNRPRINPLFAESEEYMRRFVLPVLIQGLESVSKERYSVDSVGD